MRAERRGERAESAAHFAKVLSSVQSVLCTFQKRSVVQALRPVD